MSSGFGRRVDPITGRMAWHAGADFAGKPGSDVIAVASGVVTFAGERNGYGRMIEINHGAGYITRYGHHDELLVAAGDVVKKGQVIGRMCSTGRSTGRTSLRSSQRRRQVDPADTSHARDRLDVASVRPSADPVRQNGAKRGNMPLFRV
jgi:murein DD-endopeptidase MepM/ murein hydrolase activator NlpD